ncbi:MAG: T9SS type A sorting domain-containing protein [Chitinophagaceae bacterium]|nr:T9SS type A sorting domain-containing protein [Chitinophagaceae bacterium]MBP6588488.1 T9SS type A sorting domain-containing protein [Chitinophagaceae bacterium]
MNQSLLTTSLYRKLLLPLFLFSCSLPVFSQQPKDLVFGNGMLMTGAPGTDNAVYFFSGVNAGMDAFVKIKGRSDAALTLIDIDNSGAGYSGSFQPQIGIGTLSAATSWWMEFEVSFVRTGTSQAASFPEMHASAIDIDGNGSAIREQIAFFGASSYLLESISSLTVNNITGTISQPSMAGIQFTGPLTSYAGMDSSLLDVIGTTRYINTNMITFRIGGTTTGSAGSNDRDYSIRFRDLSASSPLNTLPVTFASFTATLNSNKKAELHWTTAVEMNTAHFEIERSLDGIQFSSQGIVLASNNSNSDRNYRFTEELGLMSAGMVWYRIRSVDQDGKTMVSGTRMIRISGNNNKAARLSLYPNPAIQALSITIPANWQNKVLTYEIVTIAGQVVNRVQRKNSSQTETLNIQSVAAGNYFVLVRCEGQVISEKLVKL